MKKFISVLLCLCMMITCLPLVAYAADTTADFNSLTYVENQKFASTVSLDGICLRTSTGMGAGFDIDDGYDGSHAIYPDASNGPVDTIYITLEDNSEFTLKSIYLEDGFGFGSSEYTIFGFLGETQKYSKTGVDVTASPYKTTFDGWTGIDEIKIVAVGSPFDVAAFIDNIEYEKTVANTAPVLDNSGAMTLTSVTEDATAPAGDTVAAIIASAGGDRITDADTGAVEGIALTGLAGDGTWQYNTGGGWTDMGSVSGTSALLLSDAASVRFVPTASNNNAQTATMTFRAWDQTSGVQGTKVDASTNDGTTAFSAVLETASISVTAVNDAPELDNNGDMTLTSVTEDATAPAGDTVAAIIASAGGDRITDADTGSSEGIAVTGLTGDGTWQYNTGGGWTAVGTVSGTSALLLSDTASVRFVPTTGNNNAQTATMTFRAWDQTSGAQGTKVDGSTNGGTTAFSTATETASMAVTAVNDAPVLDNSAAMTLTSVTEDATAPAGDTVAAVIASAGGNRITDADSGAAEGIAVTGLTGDGAWQYNTGGGWTDMGSVSGTSALLLSDAASVRFVPTASNNAAQTATITFRAWDRTVGVQGTKVDVSTNGGTTAFSTATETASISVTAVNDAPAVTTPTAITCTDTAADDSFGNTTGTLLAADIDGTVVSYGISTGTTGGSTDIGGTVYDVSKTGTYGTLYVKSDDGKYAFVPNAAAINAVASNQSETYTVTATDDASSTGSATMTVNITGANDTPTVLEVPTTVTAAEDTASDIDLSAVTFSDADGDSLTVTLTASAGTFAANSGGSVTVGGSGSGTLTLTGTAANINVYLDTTTNIKYTSALNATGAPAATITVNVNDNTVNPLLGTVNINITAVNDDPGITGLPTDITVVEDMTGNVDLSSSTLTDVDSASANIILTLTASSGTLTAASGGDVTVSNSGTDALTLTGTALNIDTYLNTSSNIKYTGASNAAGNDAATLTLTANDAGNTGTGGGTNVSLGTVNIDITPVNDEPSFTIGADQTAAQNAGAQTVNGFITNINDGEADEAQTVSFTVSNDNNALFLTQPAISASGTLTFTPDSTQTGEAIVTVYLRDDGGTANGGADQSAAQTFKITIAAVPTVTGVASDKNNGTYSIGETLEIKVEFSENVTVTGTPQLTLETGIVDRTIDYASGSGTNVLTFTYTTQAGDETTDLDYKDINSLSGTIKDAAGSNAILTLLSPGAAGSLGANKDIAVQAFPTVTLSVGSASIAEAAGTSSITATLSAVSSQDVIVTLTYSGTATSATDYNSTASTTITIPAGSTSASTATGITAIQDTDTEGNETIIIEITGVSKGIESGAQQKIVTILDDDIFAPGAPTGVTATAGDGRATVSFTPPVSDGGAAITGYTVTSSPGGITASGASSPIVITGLTNGTSYTFTVKATNSVGTGADSSPSNSVTPQAVYYATPTTPPTNSAEIIVNGESQTAGTTETTTNTDGQSVTTVTVDADKLEDILEAEGTGATVIIPVTDGADVAAGTLTGKMVKNMEDKDATLVIQTDSGSYTIPASEINIEAVSEQLGTDVSLSDITVTVGISEPSASMTQVVENAAQDGSFTIMVPAVDYTISCTYGDQTVDVTSFTAYVERTIAIPDGVDPTKITTGVVVDPDGTVHHVPTRVTMIDGKYYAVINSLTNSTYSVIWNPVEFSDITNHWAKYAINDMGSRMVVTGTGNGIYEPERSITRAEFAAIIVRALGLAQGTAESSFGDVTVTDWFNGYVDTATSYNLITGYDSASFAPNDTITREQAMTILARAMKLTGLSVSLTDSEVSALLAGYTDGASVSSYAKMGVAACIKTGVVTGTTASTLSPKDSVTRAEVAVMVQRLLEKSGLI
ncbi:MAG: hypothetical protein EOM54_00015 [Clostridia bacterium]|nr:hypothetical protein [Clostridia bacterium]